MRAARALLALLALAGHGAGGAGGAGPLAGLYTGPYFDPAAPTNVSAQLGTHAYLPCKVRQLSNKSVSWIRRRDAHILTVDRFTFIADERFQAFLVEATDTWTLQVKYVQPRDAGVYECQVGTEPKMSHFVRLEVVVPRVAIAGEAELYVRAGSAVRLQCVVGRAPDPPAYVFWLRDGARLAGAGGPGRAEAVARPAPDTTLATLTLAAPRREDSGNYTCAPAGLPNASVMLHVLSGEQPAAMQHGNAATRGGPFLQLLLALLLLACHDVGRP